MDLYEACENGNEERVVELLLLGDDGVVGAPKRSVFGSRTGAVATADRPIQTPQEAPIMAPARTPAAMLQARGTAGRTPLLAACMGVQVGVVRLLLGEPCAVRFTGRSKEETQALLAPLAHKYRRQYSVAAPEQSSGESPMLFDVTLMANSGQEPIAMAVVRLPADRVVAARDLLQALVHVDDFGNTPLQCASCFGCGSTTQHVDDCLEITRLLLAHGDQPNVPKLANKWTPLHWSAYHGSHEQAAVLLGLDAQAGTSVAKTQLAIPLMVNDDGLFPADVAGRRGLALMDEMQLLRGSRAAAARLDETESRGTDASAAYARWRLRLDHMAVLRLFVREFVEHAGELQRYVGEMNSRVPVALLRGKQLASARKRRFSSADAVRYGQHLLYWAGCFGLVDELRALLRLQLRAPADPQQAPSTRGPLVPLQPLYACSCEENKRQSVLHAVAALGRADVVSLLLQELLDAQRLAPIPSQTAPTVARGGAVAPSPAEDASEPSSARALLDATALVGSGWTNHRQETPLFLAALFLRHDAVAALARVLSPASLAWELSSCTVEGAFIRHVADRETAQALGIGGGQSLVSGEYVLLFDGDGGKAFKESLIETLREDSATAPSLVVTRAGSRETRRWLRPPRRTDYVVVGAASEVLSRHAERLQLKVKHRGSAVRSRFRAAAAARFEPLRSLQRQQVVLDVMHKNVDLQAHLRRGHLAAAFPLHDASGCRNIMRQWVRSDAGARVFQPLGTGRLRQFLLERRAHPYEMLWPLLTYFGEKHAFYYAFVGFYSSWLLLVAAPGALCQLLWLAPSLRFVTPLFAVVVSLWATLLVERWKRKRSEIQRCFGRFQRNRAEQAPGFYGDFQVEAPDKPGVELTFPRSVQLARIYCGLPLLLALGCSCVAVFIGVRSSDTSARLVSRTLPGLPAALVPYLAPLLNAASMLALDHLYTRVARALTRWENHRTVWQHESMLAAKLFWFKFLNAFLSLFWVAFVDRDAAALRTQLAIVMGVRQVWYMAVRSVLPLVVVRRRWRAAGFCSRRTPRSPRQWWSVSIAMFEWYDAERATDAKTRGGSGDVPPMVLVQELMQPPDFLMGKQMEAILQFGYVTMFVAVLPAAPLLALLSNVVTTRLDVWSCTQAKQRPPFESETEVQTFMSILEFMSFAAVAVNCGVLFFTVQDDLESLLLLLRFHAWAGGADYYIGKLWTLFIVEHVVLGAKAFLSLAIDDSAAWVQQDEDREDDEDKKRLLKECATDWNARDGHGSSHSDSKAAIATERCDHRPAAAVESVVDELLDLVAREGSASLPAISLASLERLNRIVTGRLAAAVADRDQALDRERAAGEKLEWAMRELASRPLLGQSTLDESSTRPRAPQDSERHFHGPSVVGKCSETPPTTLRTAAASESLRQCFFCFALWGDAIAGPKRCLSCRVFLCTPCDATLHLDEPTHMRVRAPPADDLERRRGPAIAPLAESEVTPLYAALREQVDAFVASGGRVEGRALAMSADEMLRRCATRASVAMRFLRNCERRQRCKVEKSMSDH